MQNERSGAAMPLAAAAVHHSATTNSNARLCGAKGGCARPRLGQSRGRRWAAPPPRGEEGGAKMAAMGGFGLHGAARSPSPGARRRRPLLGEGSRATPAAQSGSGDAGEARRLWRTGLPQLLPARPVTFPRPRRGGV